MAYGESIGHVIDVSLRGNGFLFIGWLQKSRWVYSLELKRSSVCVPDITVVLRRSVMILLQYFRLSIIQTRPLSLERSSQYHVTRPTQTRWTGGTSGTQTYQSPSSLSMVNWLMVTQGSSLSVLLTTIWRCCRQSGLTRESILAWKTQLSALDTSPVSQWQVWSRTKGEMWMISYCSVMNVLCRTCMRPGIKSKWNQIK